MRRSGNVCIARGMPGNVEEFSQTRSMTPFYSFLDVRACTSVCVKCQGRLFAMGEKLQEGLWPDRLHDSNQTSHSYSGGGAGCYWRYLSS
jgi:hypothetical protein